MRIIIFLRPAVTHVLSVLCEKRFSGKKQIYFPRIKLYVLVTVTMNDHTSCPPCQVCQKWLIIIIPICPSPWSCTIIFQVPGEEPKSLYLPLANSSSLTYESCEEYLDPSDHSQGSTVCSQGFEFQFDGDNEWTITAEVTGSMVCCTYSANIRVEYYFYLFPPH